VPGSPGACRSACPCHDPSTLDSGCTLTLCHLRRGLCAEGRTSSHTSGLSCRMSAPGRCATSAAPPWTWRRGWRQRQHPARRPPAESLSLSPVALTALAAGIPHPNSYFRRCATAAVVSAAAGRNQCTCSRQNWKCGRLRAGRELSCDSYRVGRAGCANIFRAPARASQFWRQIQLRFMKLCIHIRCPASSCACATPAIHADPVDGDAEQPDLRATLDERRHRTGRALSGGYARSPSGRCGRVLLPIRQAFCASTGQVGRGVPLARQASRGRCFGVKAVGV
jgi:hypothetical protein